MKTKPFFLLMIFSLTLPTATAYFFNITYECAQGICVEGHDAVWIIEIENQGNYGLEFTTIELIDTFNDSTITEIRIPFNPQSSERGDTIVVGINKIKFINLTGTLPSANLGSRLYYYPCFTNTVTDTLSIAKFDEYEIRHCYVENLTMQLVQCISNTDCDQDQICLRNSCTNLKCGSCQYFENHTCLDYECCAPEQCSYDEICANNICKNLNCSFSEYVDNRTCRILNCAFDQYISNRTCTKLDCKQDEFFFNHTCKKLECGQDEFIKENACAKLDCRYDEHAVNNTCMPLNCLASEAYENHACVPLKCNFFQEEGPHMCITQKADIIKLLFELFSIVVIATFTFLLVRKYFKGKTLKSNDFRIRLR